MKWSDIQFNPSSRTLRQFAGAWLLVFIAMAFGKGLAPHFQPAGVRLALVALVVGLPGLIHPPVVRWMFVCAMILAFPVGWVVSQAALVVIFYMVFTPVGLLLRLTGRDVLDLRGAKRDSYWIPKKLPDDMRRYLRQY